MPRATSDIRPGDLLPHESAPQTLWDATDDSWVRAPRRERSTLSVVGGVILIIMGANFGQMALGMTIGLFGAIAMSDSSALLTSLAMVFGFAAAGGLCLWGGIKLVSGKSSRDR